jgi:hypothetical protein
MRVTFAHEHHFDEIFGDADFATLTELIHGHEVARRIIAALLAAFRQRQRPDGIRRFANDWARTHPASPTDIEWIADEIGPRLDKLYGRYDPGRVRGGLVERLVYHQIKPRYEHNTLADNTVATLSNGIEYTTPTSIDVAGWDGHLGEFHDCRARSDKLNLDLVRDLEANLPREHFAIGLVTLKSRVLMAKDLSDQGYVPTEQTTLIPLEGLWTLAPLQRAAA